VQGFVPPDYLVHGILHRGFLYSLTGRTGSGKTAVMLRLSAMVAGLDEQLGDNEVEKGKVLYFAGENPDDVRMRVIAMCEATGVQP
jgi:RecA-family ATPase